MSRKNFPVLFDQIRVMLPDEKTRRVFEAIPNDRAISLDKLMALGYKVNELIAATTFLEIKGLINSLPGSLYIRK